MGKCSKIVEPEAVTQTELTNRRRIGILGGTFNPPHIAHLMISEQVRDQLGLEGIQFMPAFTPPHREEKKTIDSMHRVEMIGLAVEDNPDFSLNLTEINRGGKSYTIDTIKELKEANPQTDYFFIIGADMVEDLPNWKDIDELIQLVQFVGVRRPSYNPETPYPVIWVDVPEYDVSSTVIREKIASGCSVRYLVPDKVIDYINEEGLYLNDETE